MAIKDWRRQSTKKIIWSHRWKNVKLYIAQNLKGKYNVVLRKGKSISNVKNLRVSLTKLQALAYAKAYMKKN